jgi:putative membrane protein
MLSLIVFIITLSVAVIFSVQNAEPVAVSFLSWHFEASLAIVIALSVLGGIIIGMAMLPWIRMRRSARKKKEPGHEASQ